MNSTFKFKRAVKRCEILRDPKNVFAPCQAKVDPATFYENCVWDQCATKLDDQGSFIVLTRVEENINGQKVSNTQISIASIRIFLH